MWNNLKEFAEWYRDNNYPLRPPFDSGVYVTDEAVSYVLYREGQYQAELYLVKPGKMPPEHSHPNVENIIIVLGGTLECSVDGKTLDAEPYWNKANADGTSVMFGYITDNLKHPSTHSVGGGPNGVALISFEKWHPNVKPTSISLDWAGPPVGSIHKETLKNI